MRLGIDFGTTNSAVAFFDGSTLTTVEIDPTTDPSNVLPSLIYVDRQHEYFLGMDAMREYAQRETGRAVRWERKVIGEFEVMVAGTGSSPIVFMQEAAVLQDEGSFGRLLQSVKTALRDGNYQGTQIFDRFYTLDELLYILLQALKHRAEAYFGDICSEVIMGRPVRFSQDDALDRRAEEILYKAARWAGFERIGFRAEPLGATYLFHNSSEERKRILVFDFGGGTLDFTIAEVGANVRPEILATHGVLVGGDDLDRRLMEHLLKYFGAGSTYKNQPFPYDILDLLLYWQTMPEVSRPEYRDILYDFREKGSNKRAIHALEKLVNNKLGFALFREIERVKKELSSQNSAVLSFKHDPIQIKEVVTRPLFERLIMPEVKKVETGLDEVLDQAGISTDDIDIVLRTGGSSLIPIFIQLLTKRFSTEKIRQMSPLTSIVGGLAVIAHDNQFTSPIYSDRYVSEDSIDSVIDNISIESDQPYESYLLHVGAYCYSDQDTQFTRIPVTLSRLPTIRLPQSDYQSSSATYLQFELKHNSNVYVAYTATASELPEWLRQFKDTGLDIQTQDVWVGIKQFKLYYHEFSAGKVILGGTHAQGFLGKVGLNYMVLVQPLCD
jgi:hypothetical chaperone protein